MTYAASLPRRETTASGAALVLAYAGAAPLIAATMAIVADADRFGAPATMVMSIYGGLLVAFFGGVRWGVAVMRAEGPSFRALLGGAVPLLAAGPFFAPIDPAMKFAYAVAALVILLIDDLNATRRGSGAPGWYLTVRAPLTVLMATAYLVAMMAVGRG